MTGLRQPLSLVLLAALTAGGSHAATTRQFAALDGLERGQWELRTRGTAETQRLCLGDARNLLQVRHTGQSCKRFVVADKANEVVVTYDCAGAGNGRTDLRVETPRLVQINSQGVADGAPFSDALEARRVGACR